MKRLRLGCVMVSLCALVASGVTHARAERRDGAQQPVASAWRELLSPPARKQKELPAGWKVVELPKGFQPSAGGGGEGGNLRLPESVDELVRESAIVVVGVGAGNDGGFYYLYSNGVRSASQFTTYYLRVEGYLKDATGRRAPFLKVLAPGGFLDGVQRPGGDVPFPYLEAGKRYLLYLTPNYGFDWGIKNAVSAGIIGRGDEYWATGQGNGRWYERDGKLQGPFSHREFREGLGMGQPFGEGVRRVYQAVQRERLGLPPLQPAAPQP